MVAASGWSWDGRSGGLWVLVRGLGKGWWSVPHWDLAPVEEKAHGLVRGWVHCLAAEMEEGLAGVKAVGTELD